MFDFLKVAMSLLPLCIKNIEWDGEILIISGDDWSFNTSSVWRVSKDKNLLFACWDNQVGRHIEELIGLSVVTGFLRISQLIHHLLFLMVEGWMYFALPFLSLGY